MRSTLDEHVTASRPVLAQETDLRARLLGVMRAKIETSEPYHRFSGILFKSAADPSSPLSPFSPESHPVRQESTALFAEVLTGSKTRVPDDLQAELPNLLWLYHMGIILFWLHDSSPQRVRTYRLIEHTVELIARVIGLASRAPAASDSHAGAAPPGRLAPGHVVTPVPAYCVRYWGMYTAWGVHAELGQLVAQRGREPCH